MTQGRLYVGTSGFAYPEWKPEFYPADLKPKDFLSFYAARLTSVEINATFYRAPTEKALAGWAGQTPEEFAFALKAPQSITHRARLRDVDEPLEYFLRVIRVMGPRLGPVLFQCPPSLRHDAGLLEMFLARLPGEGFRFAMEFRHPSWDIPEVRGMLGDHGVAWCVADTDERDAQMAVTAEDFAYLRLRKPDYGDEALARWAGAISERLVAGSDVYCYFKHEDDPSGARFAVRMRELIV